MLSYVFGPPGMYVGRISGTAHLKPEALGLQKPQPRHLPYHYSAAIWRILVTIAISLEMHDGDEKLGKKGKRLRIATKIQLLGPWPRPNLHKISPKTLHEILNHLEDKQTIRQTDRQTDKK